MSPSRDVPGPQAVTCPACGHENVRLLVDGTMQAHTQPENYDRMCHARWPNEYVRIWKPEYLRRPQ